MFTKRAPCYFSFLILCLLNLSVEGTPSQNVTFSPSNLPQFKDYPIQEIYKGKAASLQLDSPEVRRFRTVLRRALKEGVNFAGHYCVVSIGCGASCQTQWIVDIKTGKALPHQFSTQFNVAYQADSNLLVLNPLKNMKDMEKNAPEVLSKWNVKTTYIVLEKGVPKTIYEEESRKLLNASE